MSPDNCLNSESYRIEEREAVSAYLSNLKYALAHGAKIRFQEQRIVDRSRNIQYTNTYTINDLFPDENPVTALRRELATLTIADYLRTVKDRRFPKLDEMREFGKVYHQKDVYLKIRVTLFDISFGGAHTTFVMSFHYAERPFSQELFPYK